MCASCGCLRGEDDHGEGGHITLDALRRAARTAGITLEEVVNNIRDTYELELGIDYASRLPRRPAGYRPDVAIAD